MLVALIAAFLLGGSSGTSSLLALFDHAEASIKTQIEDRSRRAELLAVIDDAESAMKGSLKSRGKDTQQLVALLRSHETKAADVQAVLARLSADAEAAQEPLIRSRFELQGRMSREEWARIFPPHKAK